MAYYCAIRRQNWNQVDVWEMDFSIEELAFVTNEVHLLLQCLLQWCAQSTYAVPQTQAQV